MKQKKKIPKSDTFKDINLVSFNKYLIKPNIVYLIIREVLFSSLTSIAVY